MAKSGNAPLRFRSDQAPSGAKTAPGRISLTGIINDVGDSPKRDMRVLGSYALVYLLKGSGRYRDAHGVNRKVGQGDCLLLFPELAHSYGPERGETWNEIYVVFEGAVFNLWRERDLLQSSNPVLRLPDVEVWRPRLESFVLAARPITPLEQAVEIARFLNLLTEIIAAAAGDSAAAHTGWLTRACDLLEADLERQISLEGVAAELGFSYESFRKQFQQQTGVPPARFRAGRVIDAACAMMQRDGLSNKEIARRLGFSDEYHFSKRFKQITGQTPRAFRRLLPRSTT